jgi:hypothetical protein
MFNSPNKSIGVIKGLESAPGKNILINGNLTVDQREKSQFGHALPTDEFVYDRWMLVANGRPEIYQIIEDGNYEPNTQYTLSWEGGTTKTVTSPASGHWNMKDSFAVSELPSWSSKKIQLEKGDTATDFELEDVGTTLAKCQRYYQAQQGTISMTAGKSVSKDLWFPWMTEMRMVPAVSVGSPDSVPTTITPYSSGLRLAITVSGIDNVNRVNSIIADAEL